MSANTNINNGYECTGLGAQILEHVRLQFIQRTDPLLGSINPDVADGAFNRELAKLHENTSSVATHFISFLNRSSFISAETAPDIGAVVNTPAGAPTTPTGFGYHEVQFTNSLVSYTYDATVGLWVELARKDAVGVTVDSTHYKKTLNLALTDDSNVVIFALPTDTDEDESVEDWSLTDIKHFFLLQNNPATENIVAAKPALSLTGSQVTVYLDSTVESGEDYTLVVVFERFTVQP